MSKACVAEKMNGGMSKKAAMKACYPAGKPGLLSKVKGKIGGYKGRRAVKKVEKKYGKSPMQDM